MEERKSIYLSKYKDWKGIFHRISHHNPSPSWRVKCICRNFLFVVIVNVKG